MPKKKPDLGIQTRKVHPKLRMISNGSQAVNSVRADFCSSIRVAPRRRLRTDAPAESITKLMTDEAPKKGKSAPVPRGIEANVFIQRVEGRARADGPSGKSLQKGSAHRIYAGQPQRDLLSTATIPLSSLKQLAEDQSVAAIELGEPLKAPTTLTDPGNPRAPRASTRRFDSGGGRGVLIGVIDVQGFDFAHRDFLDSNGSTRFDRIWDQGSSNRPSPAGFDYGAEIQQAHMNQALRAAADGGLAATVLEPQSQMVPGSHGTHVASIAAGNRGICRNAFLAGVLVSLPEEDLDRRRSFYESTRLAHAIDYLLGVAEELRRQHNLEELPVSINVSLGTNGHAHDGSNAINRWIDSALTVPGRAVCVAAGNAGQEAPETQEDLGYIMGRIHTSGQIPARGLDANLEWIVVGNTIEDLSENELEIWYSPADRFSVSVKPPGMDWTEPIAPGEFIENRQLDDGSFLSVYNELYHAANGANYIAIYLSPFLGSVIKGSAAGTWQVRLHGLEVRNGHYHAWIERDDPRPLGRIGSRELWQFPSFFSTGSNVDNSSISSLGCGRWIISVANLHEAKEAMNITSSQGPTRDGRQKPDVAAPGTGIVAANGFASDTGRDWVAKTGTSMASPFVTGVVGLMLSKNAQLTAAQIAGLIQRTARPLPGSDFTWRDDSGYGVIDPTACLAEVKHVHTREDRT